MHLAGEIDAGNLTFFEPKAISAPAIAFVKKTILHNLQSRYAVNRSMSGERSGLEGNSSTTDSALRDAQTMHCGDSNGTNDDAFKRSNEE